MQNIFYRNQRGVIAPTLILIAVVGMLAFFTVSNTFNFKDKLFYYLFPKPASFAANPVTTVTIGNLTLSSTFNSIGVELKATSASTGSLEYKKLGETTWKQTLPMWQAGGALYGSVLLAQAGTTYDIRVTPLGGTAVDGSISTRAENIPPASSLTPTHYVMANGNDASNGTSPTSAWKTLGKAATSAPANAVVQVGPGFFAGNVQFVNPVTVIAQFPALDDGRNEINVGQHSVIESPSFTAPGSGAWTTLAGAPCTVYKWVSPVNDTFNLGYSSTKAELPKRIAKWDRKGTGMTTVSDTANLMCTNKTYNYGFFTNGTEIYARLPQDLNPNTVYVSTYGNGVTVHGPNIRISGFEIRQGSVAIDQYANFAIADHNLIGMGNFYMPAGKDNTTSYYGGDHVVQYNKVVEYGIWSDDPSNKAINWTFVKGNITKADGTWYEINRLGANSEGTGFMGGSGGAKRVVARFNTLDGGFNGVTYYNVGFDKYATQDQDIHDNLFKHIADDTFEPEQVGINWRIWNNRIENAGTILSTGPLAYGPIFLFRNQGFRNGYYEGSDGLGSIFFKYSGGSNPMARIYVINNTFWSDNNSDGGNQYAGGGPGSESFYLRNNIMHSQRYAFKPPTYNTLQWDETNNYFSSTGSTASGCTKAACGLEAYGTFTTDVAGYRTAYQTGTGGRTTNTNIGWNSATGVGNFNYNPGVWFTNILSGDLSLKSTSPLVDAGIIVPNISECYAGSAPDLGAIETGAETNCPLFIPSPIPSPSIVGATPLPIPSPSAIVVTSPSSTPILNTPTGATNGLVANYYNGNWWDSPVALTRTDPNIDFNWGSDSPASGINPDSFSVTWNGYIEVPSSGTYTFYANADDGVEVSINGSKIIDRLFYGTNEISGSIALQAGQKYPIKLGFIEGNVGAFVNLSWSSPALIKQIIPTTSLFTSISTTSPLPTPTPTPVPAPSTAAPIDTITPQVSISIPTSGAIIGRNSSFTTQATATDNVSIAKVEFYQDNILKCTRTTAPYSCNSKLGGKSGVMHIIMAKAYDKSGNTASVTIQVKSK